MYLKAPPLSLNVTLQLLPLALVERPSTASGSLVLLLPVLPSNLSQLISVSYLAMCRALNFTTSLKKTNIESLFFPSELNHFAASAPSVSSTKLVVLCLVRLLSSVDVCSCTEEGAYEVLNTCLVC